MDGYLLAVTGLLGVLVGLAASVGFRYSERVQHTLPAQTEPDLDDGLVRTLGVLRSAAVVLDEDDVVVRASPPAYALGVVRDGGIPHAVIRDMVRDVRRDGVIRDEELELPRGPMGPARVMLQVRVANVGPRHVVVLAEDRTEARRLEAIRRDFVVNVSHELKTPVGALSLLAETVQAAADDPEAVRRFSQRMQQESARLSALVHEIIELSRLQVAGALNQPAPVDVGEVLSDAVDRARTAASAKSIALHPGGETGLTVYGDKALLVTAVRNLLDNAVAYSPPGTQVGVGVRRAGDMVEIAVVDQGIGIAPDVQERVFERFFRVDPARSRDTGGTGLGLSIVKHVAADHGGEVAVWSQPGKGSTFTLRIPAAHLPPGAPGAPGATTKEVDA